MPKIIQITNAEYHSPRTGSGTFLHALLDDGSVHYRNLEGHWLPVALPSAWMPEPRIATSRQSQRPEWDTFISDIHLELRQRHYIQCPCGNKLNNLQLVREHWQQGHFDA
jgi:hypothetical protein